MAEIADERGFTVGTIENHLGRYIAEGKIKIESFMKMNKVKAAVKFFEKNPEATSSDVKATMGNDFSYSEIKFVRNYITFLESKK